MKGDQRKKNVLWLNMKHENILSILLLKKKCKIKGKITSNKAKSQEYTLVMNLISRPREQVGKEKRDDGRGREGRKGLAGGKREGNG